jgi:ATP-dependent DNA ligase
MTESYPDIVKLIEEAVSLSKEKLKDFILDSEIVAFDSRTNRIRSF